MTCNYVNKEGDCTYRGNHAKNKHVGGFCNGLPDDCPWHVMRDKGAYP